MPYSQEHKQRSRDKILQSASELFPRQGFDAVSIDQVMENAGMTRGAFYNHFNNKSELYAESMLYASLRNPFATEKNSAASDSVWFERTVANYLSREHIEDVASPCPLAFLVNDVNQRDYEVREVYTRIYKNLMRTMRERLTQTDSDNLMAASAMMIGGVAIARALNDERYADKLLGVCNETVREMMGVE